jgi:hypothetical protein
MRKIVLLSLLVCFCWGCGTGHYEELLDHRKTTAAANPLSPPQDLPGTKVSVRVPLRLGSPVPESQDNRYKPGLVTIPGLKQTYEAFIEDREGGQQFYYCYIGAVEAAGNSLQDVANRLRTELGSQPQPNQLGDWTDFQVDTPERRKVSWKRLRFTGNQQFFYKKKDGQATPMPMGGTLEIYLHEEAGFVVIVAWRLPTAIEVKDYANLDELTQQTAGGVSVRP